MVGTRACIRNITDLINSPVAGCAVFRFLSAVLCVELFMDFNCIVVVFLSPPVIISTVLNNTIDKENILPKSYIYGSPALCWALAAFSVS
jgi:hypothetical protein